MCSAVSTGHPLPGYVLDVPGQGATVGQPVVLAAAANTNPGEDFSASFQGTVSDFVLAGLMSQDLEALYGPLNVFEYEYAPQGVFSGLCAGVGTVPGNGTRITLQPCGVTVRTTWIEETAQAPNSEYSLINGATAADFAHPPALTDLQPGLPLFTFASTSVGGAIFANQTWGAMAGVLPVAAGHAARQVDRAPAAAALVGTPSPATAYVANLDRRHGDAGRRSSQHCGACDCGRRVSGWGGVRRTAGRHTLPTGTPTR